MSKYKFQVGQRVLFKNITATKAIAWVKERHKIKPLHAFGNYYTLTDGSLWVTHNVPESSITAIEESK